MYQILHDSVHFLVLLISDIFAYVTRIIYALENKLGLILREHLVRILEDWKNKGITDINQACDVAPEPIKKEDPKKQYMTEGKTYSDKDFFDVFE